MIANARLIQRRSRLVPRGDGGEILVRGAVSFGVLKLHGTVGPCLYVSLADLAPSAQQVRRFPTLVRHEDDVHLFQGVDGLHGDVVRIAGADPDELQLSHGEPACGNGAAASGTLAARSSQSVRAS